MDIKSVTREIFIKGLVDIAQVDNVKVHNISNTNIKVDVYISIDNISIFKNPSNSNKIGFLTFSIDTNVMKHLIINIKDNFSGTGIGFKLAKIIVKIAKTLKLKTIIIITNDIGRYAWLNLENLTFFNERIQSEVYKAWVNVQNMFPANITKTSIPLEYPKEFLLSVYAPAMIQYKINI
jgi:hypothetical protein